MNFITKISALFLGLWMMNSCTKNDAPTKEADTTLPNFSNVDIERVFSRDDGKFEERDSVRTALNHYYRNIWEDGDLWGGILVAKGDKILLEKYRGFAQSNHKKAIDKNTPLHIASVSKPLTAMATLKLVDAGKLKLSDSVTRFFSKFPYPKITIKELLSHRSGLPRYELFIPEIKPQPKELAKRFITNEDILNLIIKYHPALARKPDTGFMYCNTNFALLALIIEKITETPFPEAMQTMVFEPLKMKHTYIFTEKDTATAAKSFYQKEEKTYPYDYLDLVYGDKNVYTTPRDLFNFSRAMYADNFLSQEIKNQIFEPYSNEKSGINNYGLGFRMKLFDNGKKLTYHNGWWHGSNSVFVHLLGSNVTIIAIGNKFSRKVYSALTLSALFEDFPYELKELSE